MTKYIIYAQLSIEIEAEDEEQAQEIAVERFKDIEKKIKDAKVGQATVADVKSGYFI